MSVLSASGVCVDLGGRPVLQDIDVKMAAGQLTALIGANGAGKTTLLNVLAGVLKPKAGVVRLGDAPLKRLPAQMRGRRIAYLPQENAVHWPLPVRDIVALGRLPFAGRSLGGLGDADRQAVDAAIAAMGLSELADRPLTDLSGGERRRALVARALVGAPEALLADEPAAGLDPARALDVIAAFRRATDNGAAALMAMHDLELAARFADRLIMLHGGRIVAEGPPAKVLTAERLAECYGVRRAASAAFELGPLERTDDGNGARGG